MKNNFLSKNIFLAPVIIFLLSGCGIFGDTSNTNSVPINLSISATENLNPDSENRASPIVIRLYQLSQIDTFNNSDFFALYENDQTLLANDLKYRQEFEIKPSQSTNKILDVSLDCKFIAIIAAFRNLDKAQWKSVIEINPLDIESINIELEQSTVLITSTQSTFF